MSPLRATDPSTSPGLQTDGSGSFYETRHEYDVQGLILSTWSPNATALPVGGPRPRIDYAYSAAAGQGDPCPDPDPLVSGPICKRYDDPTLAMDWSRGIECSWAQPRFVVRHAGIPYQPGEASCVVSRALLDGDERLVPGVVDLEDMRGRAVETHTWGEPLTSFVRDERGNVTAAYSSYVDAQVPAALLDTYEYEDIVVSDPMMDPPTRTVRRLVAHDWPAHVVDGASYRQRDEYEYHPVTCPDPGASLDPSCYQGGFLATLIEDANGARRKTHFEHDRLGRLKRKVDPAGNVTKFTVNALGQVLREEVAWKTASNASGTPMRVDRHFDAADRVVRTDVRRLGLGGGVDPSDPRATTITRHDVAGRPIAVIQEIEPVAEGVLRAIEADSDWFKPFENDPALLERMAITRFHYGPDGQLWRTERPEAVAGRQPQDAEERSYDERGLPYRVTLAPGTPAELVTQTDYDGNRNPIRLIEGVNTATPRMTRNVYDGYDILRATVDAMGNERHFDTVGPRLIRREWVIGQLIDVAGNASAHCLSAKRIDYDERLRPVASAVAVFDPADVPDTCDSIYDTPSVWATTTSVLTPRGLITSTTDALGRITRFEVDSLGRSVATIGPTGDRVDLELDVNGVAVRTTSVQQSDLGLPPLVVETSQRAVPPCAVTAVGDAFAVSSRRSRVAPHRNAPRASACSRPPTPRASSLGSTTTSPEGCSQRAGSSGCAARSSGRS